MMAGLEDDSMMVLYFLAKLIHSSLCLYLKAISESIIEKKNNNNFICGHIFSKTVYYF